MKISIIEVVVVLLLVVTLFFVAKTLVIPSINTLMTCNDTVVRGLFKLECIKVNK